VYDVTHTLAIG